MNVVGVSSDCVVAFSKRMRFSDLKYQPDELVSCLDLVGKFCHFLFESGLQLRPKFFYAIEITAIGRNSN